MSINSEKVIKFEPLHYFDDAEVIRLDKPLRIKNTERMYYVFLNDQRENVLYKHYCVKLKMEIPTYCYIQYRFYSNGSHSHSAYYTHNLLDFFYYMEHKLNQDKSTIESYAETDGVLSTINPWLTIINDKV